MHKCIKICFKKQTKGRFFVNIADYFILNYVFFFINHFMDPVFHEPFYVSISWFQPEAFFFDDSRMDLETFSGHLRKFFYHGNPKEPPTPLPRK